MGRYPPRLMPKGLSIRRCPRSNRRVLAMNQERVLTQGKQGFSCDGYFGWKLAIDFIGTAKGYLGMTMSV